MFIGNVGHHWLLGLLYGFSKDGGADEFLAAIAKRGP